MTLSKLFIELPARIIDLWFLLYRALLALMVMAVVTLTVVSLGLYMFGIRWGW